MQLQSQKSLKGFTLLEILIGLTIIGFLFGLGFINYRDFSRRQNLASIGKQIQGDIRLAQQMALAGQKPTDGSCMVMDGVGFRVESSTVYRVQAQCDQAAEYIYKEVTLPSDITIGTSGTNPIIFKVLGLGNNIQGGTSITITVTQITTGATYPITVTSGGEVK